MLVCLWLVCVITDLFGSFVVVVVGWWCCWFWVGWLFLFGVLRALVFCAVWLCGVVFSIFVGLWVGCLGDLCGI